MFYKIIEVIAYNCGKTGMMLKENMNDKVCDEDEDDNGSEGTNREGEDENDL